MCRSSSAPDGQTETEAGKTEGERDRGRRGRRAMRIASREYFLPATVWDGMGWGGREREGKGGREREKEREGRREREREREGKRERG